MILKTIIETESGSKYVMENDGLTRLSEHPLQNGAKVMIRNEPFIIVTLVVGLCMVIELPEIGGFIRTSPVRSIEDVEG